MWPDRVESQRDLFVVLIFGNGKTHPGMYAALVSGGDSMFQMNGCSAAGWDEDVLVARWLRN